jgi:hypothetical protein
MPHLRKVLAVAALFGCAWACAGSNAGENKPASMKMPDRSPCELLERHMREPSSTVAESAARDACESALRIRAAYVIDLYHRGDCVALEAWTHDPSVSSFEKVLVGSLLRELGDHRGSSMIAAAFPLPSVRTPEDDPALFLPAEEGCAPGVCIDGNEPECRPWFGSDAKGGCISTKYGDLPGCMPGFCREPHEQLVQDAVNGVADARRRLAEVLATRDGYVWAQVCACGLRRIYASSEEALAQARNAAETHAVRICYERAVKQDCDFLVEDAPVSRRCGHPSDKRELQ